MAGALSLSLGLVSSALAREPGGTPCEHPAPARERVRYVVAALGDSLTDTRVGGGLYLEALRERCPASRFDAYGVGGQQTSHLRWRTLRDVFGVGASSKPPAYTDLIVLGGINDLSRASLSHAGTAWSESNLGAIYDTARRRGVRVTALTVPPWTGLVGVADARVAATHRLNAWIHAQLEGGRVDQVVDPYHELECGAPDVLCPAYRRFGTDLVHWNRAGHAVVGEALWQNVFRDCA